MNSQFLISRPPDWWQKKVKIAEEVFSDGAFVFENKWELDSAWTWIEGLLYDLNRLVEGNIKDDVEKSFYLFAFNEIDYELLERVGVGV